MSSLENGSVQDDAVSSKTSGELKKSQKGKLALKKLAKLSDAQLADIIRTKLYPCTNPDHTSSANHKHCKSYHKDKKDRRRFIISATYLKNLGLTEDSPLEELVPAFRAILEKDDDNSWQDFSYKSRRCTNREHKLALANADYDLS